MPVQEDKHVYDLIVASDGQNIFNVFEEGGSIRGMLVDAEGQPLLPSMPFYAPWSEAIGNYYPSVAFGGGVYLVAWTGDGTQALIIGTDGVPQGEALQLSETGYSPAIAWLQDKFVVVWQEADEAGSDIALATVDPAGNATAAILITDDGTASEPKLAAAGNSGALVSWAPNSNAMNLGVQALLLDGQAEVASEPLTVRTATGASAPEVVSDGTGYLVAWLESQADSGVMAAMVSSSGIVSDHFPVSGAGSLSELTLGVGSSDYVAVWKDYTPEGTDNLAYMRISPSGATLTGGVLNAYPATSSTKPALLQQGEGYWIAYQGSGVFGAFTDDDLTPTGEPVGLSLVPHSQNAAVMAFDGRNYVLAWADEREGDSVFSGRVVRVNQAGRVLDAEPFLLTDGSNRGSWYLASSVGGGSSVLTWTVADSRQVNVRSLSSEGALSTTLPIGAPGYSGNASLAKHDGQYLLLYPGSVMGQFWAQRLAADGNPSGEPIALEVPPETQDLTLLGTHDGYLVLIGFSAETQIASITADGSIGTPSVLGTGHFPVESVIGGGKTVLVRPLGDGQRVGRFYNADGWQGDEFVIGQDARSGQTAWDGTQFVSAWQDSDYFGHWATFDLEGNVSPSEILFADQECGPSLVSNGAGQLLLSCLRYDRDYSRRIVNYLVGEPHPDTDSPTPPSDVDAGAEAPSEEPPPEPGTEPSAAASGEPPPEPEPAASDATSEADGPTDDPAPSPSNTEGEGETDAGTTAQDVEGMADTDISTAGDVDAGAGQQLNPTNEGSDDSGCQLGVGTGSGTSAATGLWSLLVLLGLARRKAQSRAASYSAGPCGPLCRVRDSLRS